MHVDSTLASPTFGPSSRSAMRQSILVLGAALGMAAGFAAAYFSTLSIFLKPIAASFGWGRAQTSAVSVLAQLGLALGAPLLGRLIDRHGAHRVIPPAMLLFVLGLFVLPSAPDSLVVFGALSLLIGVAGVATTPAGYLNVLPPAFDRRLGLALGLAMVGLGGGAALMPIIVQGWIEAGGWRDAYRSLALTALIGGGLATTMLFGRQWLQPRKTATGRHVAAAQGVGGETFGTAVRTGRFWLIAIVLFVVSTAGLGAMVHMVPMLTDRGVAAGQAAKFAGLIGLGIMLGRVAAGALMDVFHARFVAAAAFLLGATGLALIAWNVSGSLLYTGAGVFLFAFTIGAEGDFIPFFVRRYFGLRCFGTLYGVLFLVYALGGVMGPVLYGFAFDSFGGYSTALHAGAAACLACAGAVIGLGPYSYRSEAVTH